MTRIYISPYNINVFVLYSVYNCIGMLLGLIDTSTQIPKIKGKILEDQCEKNYYKKGGLQRPNADSRY